MFAQVEGLWPALMQGHWARACATAARLLHGQILNPARCGDFGHVEYGVAAVGEPLRLPAPFASAVVPTVRDCLRLTDPPHS